MRTSPESQRGLFMGLAESSEMSISGTRKSGRVQNNAKSGAHFVRESANKKVTKNLKNRALCSTRRTLSGTSVPHLVDFLQYPDQISMIAFRPVWDVYYYTSRPRESANGIGARADFKFAEFSVSGRPRPWRNLRGARGGGACSSKRGATFCPPWHSARFPDPTFLKIPDF